MGLKASEIWTWRGRVGRTRYLLTGLILIAVKHNLDRLLAFAYDYRWGVFNYWVFSTPGGIENLDQRDATFFSVLLRAALPFIWVGVVLTIRRLRDINWPLWLVVLFFAPFLNLLFFILLSVVPSASSNPDESSRIGSIWSKYIPRSEFGSAVLGVVATAILAVLVTVMSTEWLGSYGWGIFVGIPFVLGLNSVLIYGFHERRSVGRCILVAMMPILIVGMSLFALAIEGVICLAMAFPLAAILALFGGLLGYALQKRPSFAPQSLRVVSVVALLMPGLTLLEYGSQDPAELTSIKSSVVIKATPDVVWKHVISFSELPQPTESLFKTGLAYPIRAKMYGEGVGAVRHCTFSTGPFVEPITTWDEPRLLQFDVTDQPRAMDELSFYNNLRPPHIDNYFISRRGQFELKTLPDGTTLLEGTTWYQNKFWPAQYWRLWSDYIIHRIHLRVLTHIKTLSEDVSGKP
jgi:uncharacterized membrane protein YhaH (DUF805 family)